MFRSVALSLLLCGAGTSSAASYNTCGNDIVSDQATVCPDGSSVVAHSGSAFSLSDTSLDFGSVLLNSRGSAQTITLTNTTVYRLSFPSTATLSSGFLSGSSQNCTHGGSGSLDAGASCTLTIYFTPTVVGTTTGRLSFKTSASSSANVIGLTGTGVWSVTRKPMVAAGFSHTLALGDDGVVRSWGSDDYGQLGLERKLLRRPSAINGLSGVSKVAAGSSFTVALKSDGTVWSLGDNQNGQLGDGSNTDRSSPVQARGISGVVAVAVGDYHTLALMRDGRVGAWGFNAQGELGDGSNSNRATPVYVSGLTDVVAVAAGEYHNVALKSDGTVWTWGQNDHGQVGNGSKLNSNKPVQVNGLIGTVAAVAAGGMSTFAIMSDRSVWAWGNNKSGQLGDGTTEDRLTPVQIPGLGGVMTIGAGLFHTVALKSDGSVWAWGNDQYWQLGDSITQNRSVPAQVAGLGGIGAIVVGATFNFAVNANGDVWGWGNNENGQLDDGTTFSASRTIPVQLPRLSGLLAMAGGLAHSIGLQADGSVWGWGLNGNGQLGNTSGTMRSTPAQVHALNGVVAVAADNTHSLALKADGSVWAWGWNAWGQLGDGTSHYRSIPTQVLKLNSVKAIAAGGYMVRSHNVAVKSDGTVWTWGINIDGQLGDGTTNARSSPVQVPGIDGVTAVAAGPYHTVAVRSSDGSVWAWGDNSSGELGDGSNTGRLVPVQASGISGVVAVAAGYKHTVAVTSDGSVWTWGDNSGGQLGDGTTTRRSSPVQVAIGDVVAVAAGQYHTLAQKSDGSVWAWGWNGNGQLGDGTGTQRLTPVRVSGIGGVVALAAGSFYNVAVGYDGSVWTWGFNGEGQLGDGTLSGHSTPVLVVNGDLKGFFDLVPSVANSYPPDKVPPFLLAASKSAGTTGINLSASIGLAPINLGRNMPAQANRFAAACASGGTCRFYVAARAPAGAKTPVCAPASAGAAESWWAPDSQRSWAGLAWPLAAFMSNSAPDPDQTVRVDILSNCDLGGQAGTEFYLGYGEDADEMLKAGRYRVILTVPDN